MDVKLMMMMMMMMMMKGTDDWVIIIWIFVIMDFHNFFIFYVFDVNESISGSFSKLSCSGDLENPGQLPVLHVLEGTDDWILRIFFNFLIFYIFFSVSLGYHIHYLRPHRDFPQVHVEPEVDLDF